MIVGLLVRSFKVYSAWTFVPISSGDLFSALIGDNGVGKSSVLEALDLFFNKYIAQWNINHTSAKAGINNSPPEICPIFMIEKKNIGHRTKVYEYLSNVNEIIWDLDAQDYNPTYNKILSQVEGHVMRLLRSGYTRDKYFLFSCGVRKYKGQTDFSMAFFANSPVWTGLIEDEDDEEEVEEDEKILNSTMREYLTEFNSYVRENIDYIYIPSELDYQQYTKIEGATIQSLMGTTVDNIIRSLIDDMVVKDINRGLDDFLKEIESHLNKYKYKKPSAYQTRFNLSHLASKIIETYFDSKVLNLKTGNSSTPIYDCSSGEKRKAIIDLAEAFILKARKSEREKLVLLAIDEPEISLHMSACFDQFSKIEGISLSGIQTLVSTHWYGFLPSVSKGCAIYISGSDAGKYSYFIDLKRFREDIKDLKTQSKGLLPSNIELKTINDTVQSVISTIVYSDVCWIVCEGASDRIYFNHFFSEYEKVRVVSVGGGKYVKQFYEYLYLALEDERSSIVGKVFLVLDTDKCFEKYHSKGSIKQISIKRLQNCPDTKVTKLESTSSANNTPATTIEDALDPRVFIETLRSFKGEYPEVVNVLSAPIIEDGKSSGYALNLRITERDILDDFFNMPGVKCEFASRYSKHPNSVELPWVHEIKKFFGII